MTGAGLRFLLVLLAVAGISATVGGVFVGTWWGSEELTAFLWGAALSTMVCYLGFLLTVWAMKRSLNAQIASVVFGFLGRLALLSAAVFLLSRFGGLPILPLGLSIVGFYFVTMALEMTFLHRSGLLWAPVSGAPRRTGSRPTSAVKMARG